MSHTEAGLCRTESSSEKKPNFFKLSGLKKGHYIKIWVDDSDEGTFEKIVQVTKVSKEPNGIQISVDYRYLYEPLFDDGLGYYKRYSQKFVNSNGTRSIRT